LTPLPQDLKSAHQEIIKLRRQLEPSDPERARRIAARFRISPQAGMVLLVIAERGAGRPIDSVKLRGRVLRVNGDGGISKVHLKVLICHIRAACGANMIVSSGRGYWMDAKSSERILKIANG
jgi:hypothetical protein